MQTITPEKLALVAALCTVLGTIIGAITSLVTTWLIKRSEERRQLNQLMVNAAIEDWKLQLEQYKIHKRPMRIWPLDIYIIRMLKFAEIVKTGKFTDTKIEKRLKEIDDFTHTLVEYKKRQKLETQDTEQ